jgi:hypothetical protein
MNQLIVIIMAGSATAAGLMLIILGFRGTEPPTDALETREPTDAQLKLRLILAATAGVVMWWVSHWPVAILLAMAGGMMAPNVLGARRRRQESITRIEAIATWCEQLRDTISSAAGLQEAIVVTSRVAPGPIRTAVQDLAAGLRHNNLSDELRRFATTIDDPAADQVAVALILASERRSNNLTDLLADVAAAARSDAEMRIRTETAREQNYNEARVVTTVVVVLFAMLLLFSRDYLTPFDSFSGQVVLTVIGSMWIFAFSAMAKLSEIRRLPRLLTVEQRAEVETPPEGGAR